MWPEEGEGEQGEFYFHLSHLNSFTIRKETSLMIMICIERGTCRLGLVREGGRHTLKYRLETNLMYCCHGIQAFGFN